MKTLLILRHAKAEALHEEGDKARQLTDRGISDARIIGDIIADVLPLCDHVVSSDAARAAMTARIVVGQWRFQGQIDFRPEIYEASVRTLLNVVRNIPVSAGTAMLVGHNPGLFDLIQHLLDGDNGIKTLPTAGAVLLKLTGAWRDAEFGAAEIIGSYCLGDK